MDRSVWRETPYVEAELQQQFELGDDVYGSEGAQLQEDVLNFVDGINQYIAEARLNPEMMPGEYPLVNRPQGPEDWKVTDVIATASLVAGIFGKGGGGEVDSALVLEAARERFGHRRGKKVWGDFRRAEDPEAPTTVRGDRFPYEKVPRKVRGRALPDPGTTKPEEVVVSSSGAGTASSSALLGGSLGATLSQLDSALGGSNALLVSGRESKGGHPTAVFGPQVAYWSPEILMEEEIYAPATPDGPPVHARGAAFPGTNLYVQLGRGPDYAWSATSAGQDIIDTFAVRLCEPDGSKPTIRSMHYRFRGQCLPFEVLERTNTWTPNAGDDTPPGTETLRSLRTERGIVSHRARINGKPYAFTRQRVTYFHEVDSALGFADYNNPRKMESPQEFQRAASRIDYTFNWFYADDRHIAYFNSGHNPVRARHVDPNFPVIGKRRFEWRDFDPGLMTEDETPPSAHPQVIDQRFITSWNNKQARGYRAADDNWSFQSVFRVKPLDDRIKAEIQGPGKMSLPELVDAMEDAGTVDLRGDAVLRWLLRVAGKRRVDDPELREAIETLQAWRRSGAHRRDADGDGTYEDAEAVRIMDAWWPRLVEAQFKPALGKRLFERIRGMASLDDPPGPVGSAYISGWYGHVKKDLRTLLGKDVEGRYSRTYCGSGKEQQGKRRQRLRSCGNTLLDSLAEALQHTSDAELYPGQPDGDCSQGDAQWCFDSVRFTDVGAISQPPIHWINRPTFQQALQIQGHR
jgi:acyl-homoserine lactone acylase PvdQ